MIVLLVLLRRGPVVMHFAASTRLSSWVFGGGWCVDLCSRIVQCILQSTTKMDAVYIHQHSRSAAIGSSNSQSQCQHFLPVYYLSGMLLFVLHWLFLLQRISDVRFEECHVYWYGRFLIWHWWSGNHSDLFPFLRTACLIVGDSLMHNVKSKSEISTIQDNEDWWIVSNFCNVAALKIKGRNSQFLRICEDEW